MEVAGSSETSGLYTLEDRRFIVTGVRTSDVVIFCVLRLQREKSV